MEKKEIYKAPEMRSVVLIKEGVMQTASQTGTWDNSIRKGTTWDTSDTDYGME